MELSLDIAELVSRARGGEPIDTSAKGEELAAKYPDLGMSGELIGKAIARAAGMLGLAIEGADEAPVRPDRRRRQAPTFRRHQISLDRKPLRDPLDAGQII